MGLVDKLTEIDEGIWKQYQKVNNYCHKEFGLDKYDLARKSNKSFLVSGVGFAGYGALENVLGSSPSHLVGDALGVAATGFLYALFRDVLKSREKEEQNLLKNGIVEVPRFKAWRPVFIPIIALGIGTCIAQFLGNFPVPEYLPTLPQESYDRLEGLQSIFNSMWLLSNISCYYFADQVPTPPAKKKSVFNTLYEKVKEKIKSEPVPQLEQAKYASIDDVVA